MRFTTSEMTDLKRMAKKGMTENGYKVSMKDMILLECNFETTEVCGLKIREITYVMFKDKKSGKQYQVTYGAQNYTMEHKSLYEVREYIA